MLSCSVAHQPTILARIWGVWGHCAKINAGLDISCSASRPRASPVLTMKQFWHLKMRFTGKYVVQAVLGSVSCSMLPFKGSRPETLPV